MDRMRCIIVDDEPLAREILEQYVADCPSLELSGSFANALEAGEHLRKNPDCLLFLDIRMPKLSGISFLRSLPDPPLVIFTTAWPEHAVEGFELDAVDYLVKPISFERFLKAVNRAIERSGTHMLRPPEEGHEKKQESYFFVRSDKRSVKVSFMDIEYFEATGDYIKIVMAGRNLLVHETMKSMLEKLPEGLFIRVHRSFIIPLEKIESLEGNRIRTRNHIIPVGLIYRDDLRKAIRENP